MMGTHYNKGLLVMAVFILFGWANGLAQNGSGHGFEHFVTVEGNKLMDGDKQLRFISFNIPNLLFTEDEMAFREEEAFELPTAYELRDALESVKQLGGQVARAYCLPVKRESDVEGIPRYVTGPGEFNERAFQTMDTLLAIANEVGVRVIIPFTNNWKWQGGRPQYAAFRDKEPDEFWTDKQLIKDFKKTIKFAANRTNTVTGVKYKDDKAIMCWETGNELTSPLSWTQEITKYIKKQDQNHLVMSGYHAINENPPRPGLISETPTVDIISSHHYETNPAHVIRNIRNNMELIDGRKPYFIGEFGFLGTAGLRQIMDFIIEHDEICAGLTWSLRYHRSEGGFYWHSEPLGYGIYKAFHWPGFESGREYDEKDFLALIRRKAFEIQGKPVPDRVAPEAPRLLPIENVASISWQGSVGAAGYDVLRSTSINGPWKTVGFNISDAKQPYWPLFHDETAKVGETYYYRIKARNIAGVSESSNTVGPVTVEEQALVDNMDNISGMYHRSDGLTIATADDRKFKEDLYRLKGSAGDTLIYYTPGEMTRWHIFAFAENEETTLEVYESPDNKNYTKIEPEQPSYFLGDLDYGYWVPIEYSSREVKGGTHFVKVIFTGETQLSRFEAYYGE